MNKFVWVSGALSGYENLRDISNNIIDEDVDPSLYKAFFISDPLANALVQAEAGYWFRLKKCCVVDESPHPEL